MMEDLYLFLEGVNFKWELIHSALGYLSPLEFEQKFYQNLLSGGCLMTSLPVPACRRAGAGRCFGRAKNKQGIYS